MRTSLKSAYLLFKADFSFSHILPVTTSSRDLGVAVSQAPEVRRGEGFAAAADVWAAGCLLYEMTTGKSLLDVFAGEIAIDKAFSLSDGRAVVDRCAEEVRARNGALGEVLLGMWREAPGDRLTAAAAADLILALPGL